MQGGSRRAPLVVTVHRRPLYLERLNAACMQHDAVTAADLEKLVLLSTGGTAMRNRALSILRARQLIIEQCHVTNDCLT